MRYVWTMPAAKVEYGSPEWNGYQAGGAVKSTPSLVEQLAPLKAELEEMVEDKRWMDLGRRAIDKAQTRRLIAEIKAIVEGGR